MTNTHPGTTGRTVEPLLVRPRDAWRMLGCGNTRGYALLAAGELVSFLDGRARKITVQSIHQYIARKIAVAGAPRRTRYCTTAAPSRPAAQTAGERGAGMTAARALDEVLIALLDWQGRIAAAAGNGGGLDVYKAALNWTKQDVPLANGLRERFKNEIVEAAERHLSAIVGSKNLDEIYFSVFPEDVAPSNAELDAVTMAKDALEYKSVGSYHMDDNGARLLRNKTGRRR